MRWNEESWAPIAQTLGFQSEEEMLNHLYTLQRFSINQISRIVGYSGFSVRRRLILLNINLRGRGGPNNKGVRLLRSLTNEQLFDGSPSKLAEEHKVHISTVFAEKRFREGEKKQDVTAVLCDSTSRVVEEGGGGETH